MDTRSSRISSRVSLSVSNFSMAAMSASNTTTQDLPCHITRVAGPATHAQREAWRWLWSRLLREESELAGGDFDALVRVVLNAFRS